MRQVPGFHGLQKDDRLAEQIQDDAHVLVIGAGGGQELKAFADTQPGWSFCGVDPSAEMLGLAKRTLGPLASRVDLHEGYIDSAPVGPFDAATCLLTSTSFRKTNADARWPRCIDGQGPVLHSSSPTSAFHGWWREGEMARPICRLCVGVLRTSRERGKCDRGHQ